MSDKVLMFLLRCQSVWWVKAKMTTRLRFGTKTTGLALGKIYGLEKIISRENEKKKILLWQNN